MSGFVPIIFGTPADRADERDVVPNAERVQRVLERLGYASDLVSVDLDLSVFEKLHARNPLCVFNLVESIRGDGRLGFAACSAMDHFKLEYTGARTSAYLQSSSKHLTKALLISHGIPTPGFWRGQDLRRGQAPPDTRVLVKSVWEHASYGLDQDSLVNGADAADEIDRREQRFSGEFFAEEYIEGREFNVSVIEHGGVPRVLPLAEMSFNRLPPDVLPIVDYDAKWNEESRGYRMMDRKFGAEASDPQLSAEIERIVLACWHASELRGYGRVDLRINAKNEVFVIEFNANPCIQAESGLAIAALAADIPYEALIAGIVRSAVP